MLLIILRVQAEYFIWRQLGSGVRSVEIAGFPVEEVSCLKSNVPLKAYQRKFGMNIKDALRMQNPRQFRTSNHCDEV